MSIKNLFSTNPQLEIEIGAHAVYCEDCIISGNLGVDTLQVENQVVTISEQKAGTDDVDFGSDSTTTVAFPSPFTYTARFRLFDFQAGGVANGIADGEELALTVTNAAIDANDLFNCNIAPQSGTDPTGFLNAYPGPSTSGQVIFRIKNSSNVTVVPTNGEIFLYVYRIGRVE